MLVAYVPLPVFSRQKIRASMFWAIDVDVRRRGEATGWALVGQKYLRQIKMYIKVCEWKYLDKISSLWCYLLLGTGLSAFQVACAPAGKADLEWFE
jgi:hypothetical protein